MHFKATNYNTLFYFIFSLPSSGPLIIVYPMSSNIITISMGTGFRGAMEIIRTAVPRNEKLSIFALQILLYVNNNSGISQGEIGKVLKRDPMTLSQAVRILTSAGLVTGHGDSVDGRIKRLSATKKGKSLADLLINREKQLLADLSRDWGRSRVTQFTKDLAEFHDYFAAQMS